jgi:prepilin-type N-terminal cleavage/methylation domain-containing protein/prepilin-type processing-associated H-X9-DG protein
MRSRRGFTLVELLVVIGIIALLISILMPSLARARQSASLVSCQSNFRQIYTACSMYANDHKGKLPASSWTRGNQDHWDNHDGPGGVDTGTNARTFIMLSQILGTRIDDAWRDPLNAVFVCKEATTDGPGVYNPAMIRHIYFHPRGFPGYDDLFDDIKFRIHQPEGLVPPGQPTPPLEHPFRQLSQIKNASEKIAFWEGAALPNWNITSEPEQIAIDTWRDSGGGWGHKFYDPVPPGNEWEDMNRTPDVGQNRDEEWWVCQWRFRHMNNTTSPVAYFDGHVEAKKLGEIRVRDLCITPP